jgi:hypothetical protein
MNLTGGGLRMDNEQGIRAKKEGFSPAICRERSPDRGIKQEDGGSVIF